VIIVQFWKRFGEAGKVCILNEESFTVKYIHKQRIHEIFNKYHDPWYLFLDPLEFVHGLCGKENREIGGLLCSVLAYGRVEQIKKSITKVFNVTGPDLNRFCKDVPFKEKKRAFNGLKHRFNTGADIAILFECASCVIKRYGSIESFFANGYRISDTTVKQALDTFARSMRLMGKQIYRNGSDTFAFFFPAPSSGSTCKRLNMYLRWMVRRSDGIDLGLWKSIPPAKLVMPVDTHVAAIAAGLGLTRRKTVDWSMAEEITAALRRCDPLDPVRFDFSLCRTGMVDFRALRNVA
jgi:uncharacterized protein (TIGR02757 family)